MVDLNEQFSRISIFLNKIGISVSVGDLPRKGFLDHTYILGTHIYCTDMSAETLGEILHEAGHIATTPSFLRDLIDGDVCCRKLVAASQQYFTKAIEIDPNPDADPVVRALMQMDDVSATAWSYAAAIAAEVP